MITICTLALLLVITTEVVTGGNVCNYDGYLKSGCFKSNKKLFHDLLITDLDETHAKWGQTMDWGNLQTALQSLACRCEALSRHKGYAYFAIGFYGECWAGKNREAISSEVFKSGSDSSSSCVGGDYGICDHSSSEPCAGVQDNEYVYEIVQEQPVVTTSAPGPAPESADQFIASTNIEIGFGDQSNGCYLYWRGDRGNTKNAEFRCKKNKGDKFWIKKRGDDYFIGFNKCPLYWRGDAGNTKNGEFRCDQTGDRFWIRPHGNGMWAIGFRNCPMYWSGDPGNTKNVEFRCGQPIKDVFWIKGVAAQPKPGNGCPVSHPYAYFTGSHCCKTNKEKVYTPQGKLCDGSTIAFDSKCCQGDQHVACPKGPGKCRNYEGGSCPASHPHAYFTGSYCCKTNKEKVYTPQGKLCDGSTIAFDSKCCQGDQHVACPVGPGKCRNYGASLPKYVFEPRGKSWDDAEKDCAERGGNLAYITNQHENHQVWKGFKKRPGIPHAWIGINDKAKEGQWILSGGMGPAKYTHWNKGEPNNLGSEQCTMMYGRSGKWNDSKCKNKYPYICQMKGY